MISVISTCSSLLIRHHRKFAGLAVWKRYNRQSTRILGNIYFDRMAPKVAVVTGANKGIGFQIVKDLCRQFKGDVFLTARDNSRGQAAVQMLEKEGLHPKYHQLDISDHSSIVRLKDFLQNTYGGLDVLVNNAGILYESELQTEKGPDTKPSTDVPFSEVAERTCQINFFANLEVSEVLLPILRPHARVCNVSSARHEKALNEISQHWKDKLFSPDIEMKELKDIMDSYVKAAKQNKHLEEGFSGFSYGMAKLAMNVMTAIHQREVDENGGEDILINACAPGFVATDLTQHKGHLTVEEGAATPVSLCLLAPNVKGPRGMFLTKEMMSKQKY
ncbi:carbonyl reductase [NADPH] 1 [Elysia marginata]|uniref:carbonyl reductase (NADPH) n=1 Tax=Elysia marginata TaxID=1093978 RepID=A0AAV4JGX1_9GAST|nr:carbonyl reductase [NADPH] 1 [Elysia marginata]